MEMFSSLVVECIEPKLHKRHGNDWHGPWLDSRQYQGLNLGPFTDMVNALSLSYKMSCSF